MDYRKNTSLFEMNFGCRKNARFMISKKYPLKMICEIGKFVQNTLNKSYKMRINKG